ncbi:M15 family metallopeptidase [Siphonobacter sp. SORGH_AS_1065]|uniref:M15 family metallopeptidase n=1 Tax=Siphonobacter sp. SORGH_AS_1065 TaxID=3041795 RepID=UPI0027876CD0|nr:M15 family metallopeptidase [Siphonobacter sp. SORGH_AS_1065]MDQ1088572.1 hypothetical protein [Siphonobacter sp. SORGH_AS_1065]
MGRKVEELHPYLAAAHNRAAAEYQRLYPDDPQPFYTETRRSTEEQTAYYAQGREKLEETNRLRKIAGLGAITFEENQRKVTNAKPGKTLHSVNPSLAYDIAFKIGNKLYYDLKYFQQYAKIVLQDPRIEWGGNWKSFVDNPHFQFRGVRASHLSQVGFDPIRFTEQFTLKK